MSQAHVDELFSAAYDGALSAEQRRSFDRHIAGCPACTAAFAELSTAVDALHELGPVPMPRPVQLPAGAPGQQRRSAPGWLRLPLRHPWASGLTGAALAAAAAVTVLIAPHLTLAPSFSSGSASQAGRSLPAAPSPAPLTVPVTGCTAVVIQGVQNAGAIPSGFNNHEVQDDGTSTVVLATPVSSYSPGETFDVYSRVVDDSTQAVEVPCTYLLPAPAGQAGVHGAGPAEDSPVMPNTALPNPGMSADGGPLLQVTVPTAATPGETLQLAVAVPAIGGQPAHQVTLSIQVT